MQTLQIFENGGTWYAAVSNTELRYVFSGATEAAQFQNAEVLAQGMLRGGEFLETAVSNCLEIGDSQVEDVINELFATTDKMMLNDNLIWAAVDEEDTVFSEIVEAGEVLEKFLEALVA